MGPWADGSTRVTLLLSTPLASALLKPWHPVSNLDPTAEPNTLVFVGAQCAYGNLALLEHHAILVRYITPCSLPAWLVFSRQLYFTGVQSVIIVMLSAALIGFGFVSAIDGFTDAISGETVLDLFALLVARSLGVVITGFVFVARSISAIASEMTLLVVTGELRTLARLGIESGPYLLYPRVLASAIAVMVLSVLFFISALWAAGFALAGRLDVQFFERVLTNLNPSVVFSGFIRAGLFAGLSVLWVQRFAVRGRRSFTEVPIGASMAVLQSIVLFLVLELVYQLSFAASFSP